MTAHKQIIDFIRTATRGLCQLSENEADAIIAIVNNNSDTKQPHAKLSRFTGTGATELLRIIKTSQQQINTQLRNALEDGPTHGFYLYELYNENNLYEGCILTANQNLFD